MEADDLDNLIADSLAGVQSALESDRKASSTSQASPEAAASTAATEAVRELQAGPTRSDGPSDGVPNEEFFSNLVKSFQEPNFQQAMADALQISDQKEGATDVATAPSASASSEAGVEEFLQNFMNTFKNAVGNDEEFGNSMTNLMTSMLSKDLITQPLQQIADAMQPWLDSQKDLSSSERTRCEAQLKLYKEIIDLYNKNPDPLPDDAQREVQDLLSKLHGLGEPPAEVMRQIAPKEAENGDESFEDFVKSMGLGEGLGAAEQDLLKKLTEDPEELTKVMKDMAGKLDGDPEEACKQQ